MRHFIFILSFITFFYSCKKDKQFSINDITETNSDGEIIGNNNPNDWKLVPINQASNHDKNAMQEYINITKKGDPTLIDFLKYKSCDAPANFSMIAYPNPLIESNCRLNFKFSTNLTYNKVYTFIYTIENKLGGGNYMTVFPNNHSEIMNAIVGRDFTYYYIFMTADSCAYYGKGNVIGCSNPLK